MRKQILAAALWAMSPVAWAGNPTASSPDAASACDRSTTAVYTSCSHDVEDNYWLAFGKCLNIADPAEREKCMEEAQATRREERTLCGEQRSVRGEVCELLGGEPYDPEIVPKNFMTPEETEADPNPYFPLVTGASWSYTEAGETDEINVLPERIVILGVTCFVVHDVVSEGGEVRENTYDWYAQDKDKNVWYFGEHTETWEDGELVSLDGSWKAGVDLARPGLIMVGHPDVGDVYRQEFMLGEVEDIGQIISITATESVPAAACHGDCVQTEDQTAIEPGVLEQKFYAPGIGVILEISLETGVRTELVDYHIPGGPIVAKATRLHDLVIDSQSFQNPFRSETRVRFELSADSDVSADVYDSTGRRIRTLAGGHRAAGSQVLSWDGKDASQGSVAPGVYFIRVQAGSQARSQKVVLVR